MPTIKGIISFPALFTPKAAKGSNEPKYGVSVLLPPGDPQIESLTVEVDAIKAGVQGGYNGTNICFAPYDEKYAGKSYHDPKFSGWYVFSCSAKEDDRPSVVGQDMQPIIDTSKVFAGCVGYVNAGMSYYPKGTAGIGGWLNGVMITDEEPPMGRLDSKPSVEQMFAGIASTPAAATAPPTPTPPTVPAGPAIMMTAKADGVTYDAYIEAGWTAEQMIDGGLAIKASVG